MPQYMRRDVSARGRKWNATPLSDIGFIDPASIAFFAQAAKETREGGGITDIFGPTAGFQERQAIRDEYNALAGSIVGLLPTLTGPVKDAITFYRATIDSVVARGAKAADLAELKEKAAEWRAMSSMTAAPGTVPVAVPAFDLAGFPWYVWAIGLGLLLPVILKRK